MSDRRRRILILGASGFLGANVALAVRARRGDALILHYRRNGTRPLIDGAELVNADVADLFQLSDLLGAVQPDVVVNCVALANVDACEVNAACADNLNHVVPARLADWTAKSGTKLIHVSTDAVFDGRNGPYGPEAPLSPVNVYGRSKQDGELAVLEKDSEALVVRTNIVGWSRTGTRSLLEYFYRGLARGEPVPGYIDIFFRPLPVHWFWPGCESFMAAGATGVVHLTGPELLSKYEFGRRVANAFGLNEELVVPVEGLTDDVKAPRPPCLDVVPSRLSGKLPVPDDLDKGLQELWRMRCGERLGE